MIKQKHSGFTLIELMIVLAIIGILAAFAIPAYNDYIGKSQVAEAVELMGGQKTPLSVYYSETGNWPATLSGTTAGKYVSSVAITEADDAAGTITIGATMAATGVNANVASKIVTLATNDGGATWTCAAVSVEEKYLPGACK